MECLTNEVLKTITINKGPDYSWKPVLKIHKFTVIRLMAYSSENNFFHPWDFYACKAYENEEYEAGLSFYDLPVMHQHSSKIEWKIENNGELFVRKTTNKSREIKVFKPLVLSGGFDLLD
jgi:hypothetical protein